MSMNDDADDELNLFKQAVADVRPIKSDRVTHQPPNKPQPIPRLVSGDECQALVNADSDDILKQELFERESSEIAAYKTNADEGQRYLINTMSMRDDTDGELNLFKQAVTNVRPLKSNGAVQHPIKKPKPTPKQFNRDEHQALIDSLSDHYIPSYELETGEELLYVRDGHSPVILSKLRRGHWVVQKHIDLHGLVSDEARAYVSEFISDCKKRGIRCVRIVHGKGLGSYNKEPILKNKVRGWLMQKDEVIAYAQAKQEDGGSGAVVVLLKA